MWNSISKFIINMEGIQTYWVYKHMIKIVLRHPFSILYKGRTSDDVNKYSKKYGKKLD
jgi:hypothetical protein